MLAQDPITKRAAPFFTSLSLFFFLLTLLLLLGAALLKSDGVSEKARLVTAARLSEMIGQPVEIEKARLTLFPPSILITGITSQGKLSLKIEEARALFSLLSFLTSSSAIGELVIRNPSLALDETALTFTPQDRSVTPKIRIEEGTLTVRSNQKTLFLPHLDVTILPDRKMNQFNVTLSGKEGHLSERNLLLTSWHGIVVVDGKEIRIQEAEVTSNKAYAKVSGVVTFPPPNSSVNLDLTVNAAVPIGEDFPGASLAQWDGVLDHFTTLSGTLQFTGRIQGTGTNPTLTGTMAIPSLVSSVPHVAPASDSPGGNAPIHSVTSYFSYKDKRLRFKKIDATIFSGQLTGTAEIDLFPPEKRWASLNLQYDQVALDQAVHFFMPEATPSLLQGSFLTGQFLLEGKKAEWTTSGKMRLTVATATPNEPHPLGAVATVPSVPSEQQVCLKCLQVLSRVEKGQLRWAGSDEKVTFDLAEISFSEGTVSFPGTWSPQTGLALNVEANGDINPVSSAIKLPVTGFAHLTGTVTGEPSRPFFAGHLQLKDWTLNGHPWGPLESDLAYRDKTISFQGGSVKSKGSGKGMARGSGMIRFGEKVVYDIQSEVYSVNPQEVISFFTPKVQLDTTASGKLRIQGEGKEILVSGPLTVGQGTLYGESFEKGSLYLTVTEKKVQIDNVRLEKKGIVAKGSGEIAYTGDYALEASVAARPFQESLLIHKFHPDISGEMRLVVRGKGSLKNPQLRFVADVAKLQYQDTPMGAGEMDVQWKGEKITAISHFPAKRFAFSGELMTRAPYPFSFQTELDYFPIHALFSKMKPSPLWGFSLYASGNVSGQGDLKHLDQIDLTSRLTLLSVNKGDYRVTNAGPIELSAKRGAFSIKNGAFKGTNTNVVLSGGLTPFRTWGLWVKGEADIRLLRLFTNLQSAKGVAHLDLRITDQWKKPKINGVLSLNGGTLYLRRMAQPILLSSLRLTFNQQRLIVESAEGKIGSGRFLGVGQATFLGFSPSQFGFNLNLTETPIRFGEQTAVVDGALLFRGSAQKQSLEGTLHIQKAVYEKRVDLRQILLDWQAHEERLPLEVPLIGSTRLNIHIYGKENIGVYNNLARVDLDVDLQMKGTLSKPLLFGQINVPKGTFRFRTNDFKIRSGIVQFVNPTKIDPVFDISGESRIRDYLLDLSLAGTLSQFTLNLSSSPSLPRADILSLLAVGKTTQEGLITEEEAKTFIIADLVSGYLAEPVKKLTTLDGIYVGAATSAKGARSSENISIHGEKRLLDDQLLVVYSKTLDPSLEDSTILFYEVGKNVSVSGGRDEDGQIGGDIRFRFEFR